MTVGSRVNLAIRRYEPHDEAAVLDLLSASLGGGPAGARPPAFFRWKHFENPFGPSFMLLAEADDRIVGLRAFMRWRFTTGDRDLTAVRAVDTATHPDYQGRGIFSTLTLAAIDALRGEVDLVFNTPNEKSLPGYLKMGWSRVGAVPIRVRVRRPIRFAHHVRSQRSPREEAGPIVPISASPASTALPPPDALSRLLERGDAHPGRIATARTPEYLRWRYASAPLLGYRAIVDGRPEEPDGLALFRVRKRGRLWETTISELLVRAGDRATARRLLRAVSHAAAVDHVTLSFPSGSTAALASRFGSIHAPGGMTLVANPLANDLSPSPTELSSWALSLGDLEVF